MKRLNSRGTLFARLERLETCAAAASRSPRIRVGHLKRLPRGYTGERHIVVKELPSQDGREWADYEEVPGPDPNPGPPVHGRPELIEVMLVGPDQNEEPA